MSNETVPIARLRLARDPLRLLAVPLTAGVAGAAAIVVGAALVGGMAGAALVAAGSVVIALGAYLAAFVFSVSIEIEPGTIHLRWLGGERRYGLVRGSVTRIVVRGPGRAPLRTRFGAIGWALGAAELRGEERIEVVRLAPTPTMILVPTDFGRLAIAAASEPDLVEALGTAARMQQRLEQSAAARPAPAPVPAAAPATPPRSARPLTGIERSLLEERLAAQRAAAEAAAREERLAAERAAAVPAAPEPAAPAPAAVVPVPAPMDATGEPTPAVAVRRGTWQRPAWLGRRRGEGRAPTSAAAVAPIVPDADAVAAAAATMPSPARAVTAARAAPTVIARPARPSAGRRPSTATLVLAGAPLVAAAAAWIASLVGGVTMPPAEERLLVLGLALAGPLGALGALAARAWHPRLGPLVSASAVAAVALVARVVVG